MPYNIARYPAGQEPRWVIWMIIAALCLSATMLIGAVVAVLLWLVL